jgi:integrase
VPCKLILQSDAYIQFINSLKSKETKEVYTRCLNYFLKHFNLSCDKLIELESKQIQHLLIDYIIDMRDNSKLSPNSISLRISALQTFFLINDVENINWVKVRRFKGEFYTTSEDRPYTLEEIKTILDNAQTLRDKAIILLFSSSGMRIGGLRNLQLKHLKRIDRYGGIYQFEVYKKSRDAYTTFCTPETRKAIDAYLDWRKRLGERLTPDSPLFRLEFETKFGASAPARPMTKVAVFEMIKKIRIESGLMQVQHLTESIKSGRPRSDVKTLHGFRKYFSTTLETEGINPVYIDILLGHNMGLKTVYSKPTPTQLLEGNGNKVLGYIHGIDTLSINKENKLKARINELEVQRSEEWLKLKKELDEVKQILESR